MKDPITIFEEELKKARTLEELQEKWREVENQLVDGNKAKLYKVYEKRARELKLEKYRELKQELEGQVKKIRKDKVDIKVRVTKKWINSRLFTAEHYVAMLQESRDGLSLLYLRKAKLVENQGYLILENRKMRKAWVLTSEPVLLERNRFIGKKYVAVHFVLPNYPYTLSLKLDEKLRDLIVKGVNGPQILHSMIKTKFFEALARVGSGPDLTMLIIGAIMGLGMGMAIGFGASEFHLASLLHPTNTTHTNTTVTK
ncbi:B277 family protein [Metallosphaera sedula]|uniref:B277 family protein n=1 Tax=Metallosphaera sedula TaxID=43687 RepID=UPI0020C0A4D4|nr:B277 family protein [Metallosphaera sedula]BBL46005.1 hypothetical protein MJ1HA_0092 [Metallosphaera sedula]BBL46081.1 hypothetical protein MJ1HA_0173 [Metallosphaera sedula]